MEKKIFLSTLFVVLCVVCQAKSSEGEKKGPLLKWTKINKANKYLLELSKTEDFTNTVFSKQVTGTQYQWVEYKPGNYFLRVTSVDPNGDLGESSRPASIEVMVTPPKLLAPQQEIQSKMGDDVAFEWTQSPSPFTKEYELEIADNKEFNDSLAYKSIEPKNEVNLYKISTYFWRVRLLNEEGEPISRYSDVQQIEVVPKTGLMLDVGPYLAYETIGNPNGDIAQRSLYALGVDFNAGWRLKYMPLLHVNLSYDRQLTQVTNVHNQNLSGWGYLLGLGVRVPISRFFVTLAYEFFGSYRCLKQTTLGQDASYTNPTGYMLRFDFYKLKLFRKTMSTFFTINYVKYAKALYGGDSAELSGNNLTLLRYGFGLSYEIR